LADPGKPAQRLVAATRNRGKVSEISAFLSDLGIEAVDPSGFPGAPEPEETGATYADNALIKARALCNFTGLPALADDSGIEVSALDGAPGVTSARYAGADQDASRNRAKLLEALSGVPAALRGARFVCVIALALPDGAEHVFRGECAGFITEAERGGGGFGYDPVFFSPELGSTFAEAAPEAKNAVSHRGRALAGLREAVTSGSLKLFAGVR
jgi:XTP/dITP diphosphohydrolase